MHLSLIIPVFNRPAEVESLLESLRHQTDHDFETVIVEDGSDDDCRQIVDRFRGKLSIHYHWKTNSGPGLTRNFGCTKASGDYFIFLDSDCVLPPHYISAVRRQLTVEYTDAFGGPDAAMEDFTALQRAINYSMTSFFTTGGIRGGSEKLEKFHPRSFNMGFSKTVFTRTGGFSSLRFGEDIDMSVRILKAGFRTQLIRDAYVYHRRRTNLRRFFKQVYNSGIARINLNFRHPGTLKPVHTAPALFTVGTFAILMLSILVSPYYILPLSAYTSVILIDAWMRNGSLKIGLLAIVASYVQLIGYGLGFLYASFKRYVMGKGEFAAFQKSFYK